jgi:hypothetical protein
MPRTLLALAFLLAATPAFAQKLTTRILKIQRLQTPVPAPKTSPLLSGFDEGIKPAAPAGASATNPGGSVDYGSFGTSTLLDTNPPAHSPARPSFARGATIRLQLPDRRIAEVTCTSVHDWDSSRERYRDCRTPPSLSTPVQAKFRRTHARLTWPSARANHKTISETYTLVSITPPPANP